MLIPKPDWVARFERRLTELAPEQPTALLPDIAETFWFFSRHREPEDVAAERAAGTLKVLTREKAWISACSEAIRDLDDRLSAEETHALAEKLWEADWVRMVDPYQMANALWDQAILMTLGCKAGEDDVDPYVVFRMPRG